MICQGEINGLSGDRPWRRWESGNNDLSGGDQWSVRGQTMEAVGVR
jgi:hypothetical protein